MDVFRFDDFRLDSADRLLTRGGVPVELNARYLDALALLLRAGGRLVSKEAFMAEVWRGVPVTDEALTQCIRTLRRQLGDDAARPRFIETVPRHGYRFIATIVPEPTSVPESVPKSGPAGVVAPPPGGSARTMLLRTGAGTIGAGLAGLTGGLAYGFAAAAQPVGGAVGGAGGGAGGGGASMLVVLVWLTMAAALTGGAGVSAGIAAASRADDPRWRIAGGAIGGMVIGGAAKLMGIDAFTLLLGRSPGDITGAPEGLVLGGAVGIGAWLGPRLFPAGRLRARIAVAAAAGSVGAVAAVLAGGRLMGGSLDLLARGFPGSRLRLDLLGAAFGETGFGPLAALASAAVEGALFAGCIVGAMLIAERRLADPDLSPGR